MTPPIKPPINPLKTNHKSSNRIELSGFNQNLFAIEIIMFNMYIYAQTCMCKHVHVCGVPPQPHPPTTLPPPKRTPKSVKIQ